MRNFILLVVVCLFFALAIQAQQITQGGLEAVNSEGKSLGACPLKHTDVKAEISGFLSRVKVTQEFENDFSEKIEAVYVFPLPSNAAVDDMTMRIGERVIKGKIMKREDAREVYEAAKSNGQITSLLDQERPNIFTQSVANILPGEKITIEISYVETLKYEDGSYEFVFPMTVAPRYIPGNPTAGGTDKVPDASKITPPIAKNRAGHDISIQVKLDAGVPVEKVESKSHQITSAMFSANSYDVNLRTEKTIPNKDFILRYDVAGKKIEDALLTHRGDNGGYFTLILQPPDKVNTEDVTPKEIVFVLDTSGSMSGFPIEKAKEAMCLALDNLNPYDTFNLITFAGDTSILFEKPVPATSENLQKAQAFLASRNGNGGTEMMKAIKAALEPSDSKQHLRIVCFMTDGEIGNDMAILGEIKNHPNARVFSFGIGSSVNRYLLDKIAEEGNGEAEFVALNDDGSAAAKRFYERVRSPLLTDISIDYGNLQVADVYPKHINDLFSAKPIIIYGRYTGDGSGVIKLKGKSFGREIVREIPVTFPESEPNHDVLATLWARSRIADLMSADYEGVQDGNAKSEVKETITNLGIEYRLLTQFTSFVAVEERVVTDNGQPRKIQVPVELPKGMNLENVVGDLPINARNLSNIYLSSGNPHGFIVQSIIGRRNQRTNQSNNGTGQGIGRGSGGGNSSTNTTIDSSVTTQTVEQLPKGTTFSSLLKVAPGVRPEPSAGGFQVDGASGSENSFIIDGQEVSNFRIGNFNNGNPFVIKAENLPKPIYPKDSKSNSTVEVEVLLDKDGKVISAKAVSGDKAFYKAAEMSAKNAKFEIPKIEYEIKQITGIITYNFTAKDKSATVSEELQKYRVELKPNKYGSIIKALVERLKTNQLEAAPDEAKFVENGRAEIIVRLKELKPETIEKLKNLGFQVLAEMPTANAVVGSIEIGKLAALAELDAVKFISSQNR